LTLSSCDLLQTSSPKSQSHVFGRRVVTSVRYTNKSGPIAGATIQRGKEVMSGKAMYAVPPVETAIREMSRTVEESEGHVSEFAASFVATNRSTCGTKGAATHGGLRCEQ
jgi:hypothetical protein